MTCSIVKTSIQTSTVTSTYAMHKIMRILTFLVLLHVVLLVLLQDYVMYHISCQQEMVMMLLLEYVYSYKYHDYMEMNVVEIDENEEYGESE